MVDEKQLRIEERRASLLLEKQLVNLHHHLDVHRRALEASGAQEAAHALQSSLWTLGVAVLEVVKLRDAL